MSQRMFPVLCGPGLRSVPWSLVAPQERQARDNHDQSLEGLAKRGGLSPAELVAVLRGEKWHKRTFKEDAEAAVELERLVKEDQSAKLQRAMSALAALTKAAKQVPIVRRSNEEPFSVCLGCGAVDSEDCATICWVYALEGAIEEAEAAEVRKKIL